ncbi:MAG: leucyl aminopeptidase [Chlorobium limicola]|uniref:Probable cytosol aminopeptidase n=1 Tax=Chlorobium limicola (strain DSM 245 / NBRC 103803 / 6330) TaxID=290315 RepID=AMPA_CHLL2|nr:leucyl aminopeptidase [Chlorobium limicola]B3ED46.1 RecName: Full=Probable cytosol aminopeptidase; AltName: Full=Leucine aminopeptidase; Short=LAP; AltName: Full=Leucyl aminopeptidase [Chlorobium limicola DSM 245]ACD90471.1 Leucyl aminopeptidase [Chlorobium limicola DSM 245]NTV21431.1 leucyl aminopeptidase [Chlorobium limicola]
MNISVTATPVKKIKTELLVVPFTTGALKKNADGILQDLGYDAVVLRDFKADAGELVILYGAAGKAIAARAALLGMGEGKKVTDFRKAAAALALKAMDMKIESVAVDFSGVKGFASSAKSSVASICSAFIEGCYTGSYRFDRLKSDKLKKKKDESDKTKEISELVLRAEPAQLSAVEDGLAAGIITGSCQNMARDLVNLPGNLLQAEDISAAAVESGKRCGFEVNVFGKEEIEALGMGGLLAVNRGSQHPPTFTVLDYKPEGKVAKTVALVGKGVTFDSGGISLKPSEGMGEMKSDMSGAASVIGAVEAVARLGLPIRVIGLIPATDNMPSGSATKPGDVITTYSGITVEVGNTDAEGRLILADALTYAKKQYNPDVIIDLATLTGACIVALGYTVAGLFSNDDRLADDIFEAGQITGEKVWRMPLWEEYDEMIKSDVADVSNLGARGAGSVTASRFLEKFIDGHKKWAHIDIAGPSFSAKGAKVSGATGFGVRLLVELLKKWS